MFSNSWDGASSSASASRSLSFSSPPGRTLTCSSERSRSISLSYRVRWSSSMRQIFCVTSSFPGFDGPFSFIAGVPGFGLMVPTGGLSAEVVEDGRCRRRRRRRRRQSSLSARRLSNESECRSSLDPEQLPVKLPPLLASLHLKPRARPGLLDVPLERLLLTS